MKYIIFLISLLCFSSCDIKQVPNEVGKFEVDVRSVKQAGFESDGHKYKVFAVWNYKHVSVVHDPDCSCHK